MDNWGEGREICRIGTNTGKRKGKGSEGRERESMARGA